MLLIKCSVSVYISYKSTLQMNNNRFSLPSLYILYAWALCFFKQIVMDYHNVSCYCVGITEVLAQTIDFCSCICLLLIIMLLLVPSSLVGWTLPRAEGCTFWAVLQCQWWGSDRPGEGLPQTAENLHARKQTGRCCLFFYISTRSTVPVCFVSCHLCECVCFKWVVKWIRKVQGCMMTLRYRWRKLSKEFEVERWDSELKAT